MMFREKAKTWKLLALTTALLLLAWPTALMADDAAGGLDADNSTFWSWVTDLHEWVAAALLDAPMPESDPPPAKPLAGEDQECMEPEGCDETFPTTDPNG